MGKQTDVAKQLDIFALFLCKTPVAKIAAQFNTTETNVRNHVQRAWKRIRGNLLAQIEREKAAAAADRKAGLADEAPREQAAGE